MTADALPLPDALTTPTRPGTTAEPTAPGAEIVTVTRTDTGDHVRLLWRVPDDEAAEMSADMGVPGLAWTDGDDYWPWSELMSTTEVVWHLTDALRHDGRDLDTVAILLDLAARPGSIVLVDRGGFDVRVWHHSGHVTKFPGEPVDLTREGPWRRHDDEYPPDLGDIGSPVTDVIASAAGNRSVWVIPGGAA